MQSIFGGDSSLKTRDSRSLKFAFSDLSLTQNRYFFISWEVIQQREKDLTPKAMRNDIFKIIVQFHSTLIQVIDFIY